MLDTKLDQQTDNQANAKQLREAISHYLYIENITPIILNKLIKKIHVDHIEKSNDQETKKKTI